MAKKNENSANAEEQNKPRIGDKDDEGFTVVGRWDIDGWYKTEPGRTIQGVVKAIRVGIDEDSGRPTLTYIVELAKPLQAKPVGEEGLQEFGPGAIIGLGETAELRVIRQSVDLQSDITIKATPTEKVKLKGKRTMWKWNVAIKAGTPRKVPLGIDAQLAAQGAQGAPDDSKAQADIPF
jgi:hypothetical protein